MTAHDLIVELRSKGVRLSLQGEQLALDMPQGALLPAELDKLRVHKHSIIEVLQQQRRVLREPPLRPRSVSTAPLSFAQARLWFINQLEGPSAAYHIQSAVRLHGALDRNALLRTLDTILERHEALRTIIVDTAEEPVQVVLEAAGFNLLELDLSAHDLAARTAALQRRIRDELLAPFDLRVGPVVRGCLVRLTPDEHVLIFTLHHIVSDGWSMGVLVGEVATLYAAYCSGHGNVLPQPSLQYADYAAWQRAWLQAEVLEQQLQYWRQQLAGAPALLELPTDCPRTEWPDFSGAGVKVILEPQLSNDLRDLARQYSATLFMVLQAGFAVLLSKLSGQSDVVIGVPVANRLRKDLEGVIGMFVNTLALRTWTRDAAGADLTVADLLRQARTTLLDAYAHQEVPFEQVVEALQPPRSSSHSPVFQVMLTLQNTPTGEHQLPGLRVSMQPPGETLEKFDLTLLLRESGEHIVGALSYRRELFERDTIERWVRYLHVVLHALTTNQSQPLSAIELRDPAERALLRQFNSRVTEYPQAACVHELFEAQVVRTPDAIALVYEGEQLSYAALDARANQLAHYLRTRGVGPDRLVGLCMQRSCELVIGVLGILKAGGAYVPLDPTYPARRLAYMLEDAAPLLVLTHERARESLASDVEYVCLDAQRALLSEQPTHPVAVPELCSQHLAYVIYTSGSTGQPKGVMVEHRGVCNVTQAFMAGIEIDSHGRTLQFASPSFDASVLEINSALCSGAALCLANREDLLPGRELMQTLQRLRITHAFLPPLAAATLQEVAALRTLVAWGEACPAALAQRWAPELRFINAYGPTETTVITTMHECTAQHRGAPPIGRPISNTQIHILDAQGAPVPIGVRGEIYVGGAGVSRGYLHREELTTQRFVRDRFNDAPGARLYRTGDLGRWRTDGSVEFLGRNDAQVKIRGYRIELGEIEAVLHAQGGVKEAAVIVREDVPGERRLVAYVIGVAETEALRAQLQSQLPQYMVPAGIVRLQSWPLTPSGKLDRNALPAPQVGAYAVREYEAPQGELENALAQIWCELLKVERVGRHDNFFELGGHSLLALQLVNYTRASLARELSLRDLFQVPTLMALARRLSVAAAPEQGIMRVPRDRPLPLSFPQQRLWHLCHASGDPAPCNRSCMVRLRGVLDRATVQAALDASVERHEALRTVFVSAVDVAVQVVQPAVPCALQWIDLSATDCEAEAQLCWHIEAEASTAFDLGHGPLLRGRLLRMSEQEHVLLLTLHPIICDGRSLQVLIREMITLYAAFKERRANPLPRLPIQYADYAVWQRDRLQGEVAQRHGAYWRQQLQGAAAVKLPYDRARPAATSYRHANTAVWLAAPLPSQLTELARGIDATLYVVLVAAYQVLLARLSGQVDITVVAPQSERSRAETVGLVGCFVNMPLLRTRVDPAMTFRQLALAVRQTVQQAQAHQELPLDGIEVQDGSVSQLLRVAFDFQVAPRESLQLPGMTLELQQSTRPVEHDLLLTVTHSAQGLHAQFDYALALFDAVTVKRFAMSFAALIEQVCASPEVPLVALALATDALVPPDALDSRIESEMAASGSPTPSIGEVRRDPGRAHRDS